MKPLDPDLPAPALYREALHTGMPTLFGIGAWGLVVGIAMIKSGLTIWQALGMTLIVFAGSAQLAALPLIAAHAPVWVIFVTALVVNLRFVIFSALMAPHFAHLPWRQRFQSRGSQFDRERDPIEAATDVHDCRRVGVGDMERDVDRFGPLDKQPDCLVLQQLLDWNGLR